MASTQLPTQKQILMFFGKKLQNISCKTFHRKTYLALFREFVSKLWSKIVWGNTYSFLTRSRPVDFTFSENFSIWKGSYALQIDI